MEVQSIQKSKRNKRKDGEKKAKISKSTSNTRKEQNSEADSCLESNGCNANGAKQYVCLSAFGDPGNGDSDDGDGNGNDGNSGKKDVCLIAFGDPGNDDGDDDGDGNGGKKGCV
jgi:hypothetical protein